MTSTRLLLLTGLLAAPSLSGFSDELVLRNGEKYINLRVVDTVGTHIEIVSFELAVFGRTERQERISKKSVLRVRYCETGPGISEYVPLTETDLAPIGIAAAPQPMIEATPINNAPIDTSAGFDKLYLNDGSWKEGKVRIVKPQSVEFFDRATGLVFEFPKTDIRIIILASGQPLMVDNAGQKPVAQPPTPKQTDEGGPPVALIIVASVGVTIAVLLIIGAIAR